MSIGINFLKASLVYFAVTVTVGILYLIRPFYAVINTSTYIVESHAHLSLIGWVSMAILGLIYCYMEEKNIKFNESSAYKGFLYLNIGIIGMPSLLFVAGMVHNTNSTATEPIIGLAMIAAILILLGAYTTAYTIIKALKK